MSNALTAGFLLVCAGAALVIMAYGPTWTGAPPWPTPVPTTQAVSKTGRVNVPNDFGVYCGATENLAIEAPKQRQARNTATLDQWVRDGHLWFLTTNTTVQMLRTSGRLSEVQATSGQHSGRVCWLPSNAIIP